MIMKREEEYLEAIYLIKLNKGTVRIKDLASALKVKPPSVTSYLMKLSNKGLVKYMKGRPIELTSKGEKVAKEVYHRHKVIKEFLCKILGLPEDIAEEDACYIEHGIHRETMEKMEKLVKVKAKRGISETT